MSTLRCAFGEASPLWLAAMRAATPVSSVRRSFAAKIRQHVGSVGFGAVRLQQKSCRCPSAAIRRTRSSSPFEVSVGRKPPACLRHACLSRTAAVFSFGARRNRQDTREPAFFAGFFLYLWYFDETLSAGFTGAGRIRVMLRSDPEVLSSIVVDRVLNHLGAPQ